jgi:hypothetical protein
MRGGRELPANDRSCAAGGKRFSDACGQLRGIPRTKAVAGKQQAAKLAKAGQDSFPVSFVGLRHRRPYKY